ncbi:UNVERIFIED_CONTAM: hypothetical protein GTU68_034936 [Idotea baltica]|nr:hypothetical protein [Idotea baltica]
MEMKKAMFEADIGDDVYGEDPTVNALEKYAAEVTGMQSAVFASSGTQSNLMGLLSHCQRGHEYIVGSTAHTYMYEGGGAAVLGGIQPCTIPFNRRGEVPLNHIAAAIKPDDNHFAVTRLLCLENTQGGKVLSLDYLDDWSQFAIARGLKRHLDGARVFNAAVSQRVAVRDICQHFDTVSICLSKGLGCPVGSVLVGDAETILAARRWRKMLGGGLRQAGMLAAAGLFALHNNVDDLARDHSNARRVCEALKALPLFALAEEPQTNMVMLDTSMDISGLIPYLKEAGICVNGHRWVFHRDVSDSDTAHLISACTAYSVA